MNYSERLTLIEDEEQFQYSSSLGTQQSNFLLPSTVWPGLPYIHQGDSMSYVSQFLNLLDEKITIIDEEPLPLPSSSNNASNRQIQMKDLNAEHEKKSKKIKKMANSPFHNYQKHLNNALKKLIAFPLITEQDELYKKVAQRIWIAYLHADIKTKKILHSVFNQNNDLRPDQDQLKNYGLWEIYRIYGQKTFKQAKGYISKLAIDQITESNIDEYLSTRKLVKRQGFKEYILTFRNELNNGLLKRRSIIEHIQG